MSIFFFGCEKKIPQPDIDSEILRLMEVYDLPSVSACVFKGENIVWKKAYGYRDLENQLPASEETLYHIGSISKLFIATAIMQLKEKGQIDLDTDINDYITIAIRNPYFPDVPITARMLMTHTSGITGTDTYPSTIAIWEEFEPDQAPSPSDWIPDFLIPSGNRYNPLIWENTKPGTYELYSNIGSNVLAFLVEQISGQNFREYCKNNIFQPLQMSNTSYNFADLDQNKIALFYTVNNIRYPFFDNRVFAAGGVKTNIFDLSRFLMAYNNGGILDNVRILQEGSIAQMFEIQNAASGLGLTWYATFGNWYGHAGGLTAGASSIVEIQPDHQSGLIIFCNKHQGQVEHGQAIYELVRQKANEYWD